MTYNEWAAQHPAAAADLNAMIGAIPWPDVADSGGQSEAWAQQQDRMRAARSGALAWRNNVGATPATCPDCGERQRPVRYGLANDSERLNRVVKSSDLILAIPRQIRPQDVGTTIAQFGAVETKRPGWSYTGNGREAAQAAFLALVRNAGGFATFSTGGLEL